MIPIFRMTFLICGIGLLFVVVLDMLLFSETSALRIPRSEIFLLVIATFAASTAMEVLEKEK